MNARYGRVVSWLEFSLSGVLSAKVRDGAVESVHLPLKDFRDDPSLLNASRVVAAFRSSAASGGGVPPLGDLYEDPLLVEAILAQEVHGS